MRSSLSDQVCGALRYKAEEMRRGGQPTAEANRLRSLANAIEENRDVTKHLAEAERWTAEIDFDLLGVALGMLDERSASSLHLWSRMVEDVAREQGSAGATPIHSE